MPIFTDIKLHPPAEQEFRAIDFEVMGHAFDLQNEMGRFFDESVFSVELYERLKRKGITAARELPIRVAHGSFSKTYYSDLVIQNSVLYELKTVDSLSPKHTSQLLNYLMLCNLSYGKAINFRTPKVEHRFVSTHLNKERRGHFELIECDWKELPNYPIRETLADLLEDWGAFLSLELYREALVQLNPTDASELPEYFLHKDNRRLGPLPFPVIAPKTILYCSASSQSLNEHKYYIKRMMALSEIRCTQWINFNKHQVTLRSILA